MGHLGGTPAEPEGQERDVALAAKRPKGVERVDNSTAARSSGRGCRSLTSIPIAADPCPQLVAEDFAGVAARQRVTDGDLARHRSYLNVRQRERVRIGPGWRTIAARCE